MRVREKPVQVVIVELREKVKWHRKAADWRPPLLVGKQVARATLRRVLFVLAG